MKVAFVSGALANRFGKGGEAWHRVSWILGLARLGFQVYFVEQINPENCLDSEGRPTNPPDSVNCAYFKRVAEQFGFSESSALLGPEGEEIYGLRTAELKDAAERADLLCNISGHLKWDPLLRRFRRRVYIDEDPGFTQFWLSAEIQGMGAAGHHHHFSVGLNIGKSGCKIPAAGIRWRPLRPLVVLEQWPVANGSCGGRFTTVAGWRGPYGPVHTGERRFGLKNHEFRKFVQLPRRSRHAFEIALDIDADDANDLRELQRNGWAIVDPAKTVPEPLSFRSYIQSSSAEFSPAKGIYVETHSGWFSDRSTRYLAAGKPVLVQDTGFSRTLPVGEGLIAFRTLQEAVDGADEICRDYDRHSRAARKLAEEYFDSDEILLGMLEEAAA